MSGDSSQPVAGLGTAADQQRPRRPRMRWTAPAATVLAMVITWWSASEDFGIGLSLQEIASNFTRAQPIIEDFLDPQWGYWPAVVDPFLETVKMAIVAAVIGCGIALGAGFLASKVTSPNTATYLADKGVLSVRGCPGARRT